jgi:tripartite-type tricarboxylate transporter receptor subunit TctC
MPIKFMPICSIKRNLCASDKRYWPARNSSRLADPALPFLRGSAVVALGLMSFLVLASSAAAQGGWNYQGRTVTLSVSGTPGGGYDSFARLLARHLSQYLPGNPAVVVRDMPGAGGLVLANYLQATAARDGTEIGELEHGTAFTSLLTRTRVSFDPMAFGWLGSMERFTPIVAAWHTVPIHSLEDLRRIPMNVGSSGAGSTTSGYPHALNAILGTKFKVISGYSGSAAINLAIERGELDGVASWCWTCLKTQKPDWVADRKLVVVMQLAKTGDPELTQMKIPTVFELASTNEQRRMLAIVFGSAIMSRPFTAPPGLPSDRLALLRTAFEETLKDPALIADGEKIGTPAEFISAEQIKNLLKTTFATAPLLIEKVRNAYSGKDER